MCTPTIDPTHRAAAAFDSRVDPSEPPSESRPDITALARAAVLALTLIVLGAAPCAAHPFNGSFELDGNLPASSFGAASGQTGYWNSFVSPLSVVRDLNGVDRGVRLSITNNSGFGYAAGWDNNPATSGDIDCLMDDYFDIGAPPFFSPGYDFHISGLDPGTYDLYTYAWQGTYGPAQRTSVEVTGPNALPAQIIGGPWNGLSFTHLTTHALHTVTIAAGQDLTLHVAPAVLTGCINGLQLVPASPVPVQRTSWGMVKAQYR